MHADICDDPAERKRMGKSVKKAACIFLLMFKPAITVQIF